VPWAHQNGGNFLGLNTSGDQTMSDSSSITRYGYSLLASESSHNRIKNKLYFPLYIFISSHYRPIFFTIPIQTIPCINRSACKRHRIIGASDVTSEADVDAVVKSRLHMNTRESDPTLRAIELFSSYMSLLRVNGLEWMIKDTPKKCVAHVLDALRPEALQQRITADLDFSHVNLKKDFFAFQNMFVLEQSSAIDTSLPLCPSR
jgi:hypothetical protein